jgi:uncharacterized membrane protein
MLFLAILLPFPNLLRSISESNFLGNLLSQMSTVTTVVKLQIGLDADWADEHNVMQTLSELSLQSSAPPANKLSEVSLALLRRQLDWNCAAFDCRLYRRVSKAELDFHHQCLSESAKLHSSGNSVPSKLLQKLQHNFQTLKNMQPSWVEFQIQDLLMVSIFQQGWNIIQM